jgi:hypothetical protein
MVKCLVFIAGANLTAFAVPKNFFALSADLKIRWNPHGARVPAKDTFRKPS